MLSEDQRLGKRPKPKERVSAPGVWDESKASRSSKGHLGTYASVLGFHQTGTVARALRGVLEFRLDSVKLLASAKSRIRDWFELTKSAFESRRT